MIGLLAEGGGMTQPPAQNNFGDTVSDGVAGPTALLIIVLLAIATVLLIRNMNKRLRRLPDRFPVPAGSAASPGSVASPASPGPTPGSTAPGSATPESAASDSAASAGPGHPGVLTDDGDAQASSDPPRPA